MTNSLLIEAELRAIWMSDIPSYRVWIDDELICERSFWPNPLKYCINEAFVVELEPGKHKFVLENIDSTEGKVFALHVKITDMNTRTSSENLLDFADIDKFQTLTFNA